MGGLAKRYNRGLRSLVYPDSLEKFQVEQGVFHNLSLEPLVESGIVPVEKVTLCNKVLKIVSSGESYKLSQDTQIPINITVKKFLEASELLNGLGINIVLVKRPGKTNYRIATFQVVPYNQLWQ